MAPRKPPTHGGARKGAGRPPVPESERTVSHSIRLHPAALELLERLCAATARNQRSVVTAALEREARRLGLELGEMLEKPLAVVKNSE